ncbi:MAG: peptidoglycan-associated lipoprotein Pal [Betaproteobacteria bacterium]|nr:peptidoglycan-associated lipoprotein Pal [Betaproteobacteria bacterium]
MRGIFMLVAASALLAACSSTPMGEQPAAGVEERSPAKPGPVPASKPVAQKPIPAVVLPGKPPAPMSPLRDPNNILSKRSVFFDYDKYDVKDEYKALVQAHAQYLRSNPGAKMLIQGNTDERGSREYNLALGQRRADAMKKMMLLVGGKEEQIESVSLGEEKPRAQGSTEEAYAQNRRGDILYSGE